MKKTKFLAFALSAAIMVMGAGYAAWSETVTINNTVQTGELKVEFVAKGLHPYAIGFDNTPSSLDNKIITEWTHGPKVTLVNIKNMYPGSTAKVEVRAENLGSIPAIADNAQVNFIGDTGDIIKNNIIVRGEVMHWRPTSSGNVVVESTGIDPDTGVPLKNLATTLTAMIGGWKLLPGDFITFDLSDEYKQKLIALGGDFQYYDKDDQHSMLFTLPSSASDTTEGIKDVQFQILFNFKQFNM